MINRFLVDQFLILKVKHLTFTNKSIVFRHKCPAITLIPLIISECHLKQVQSDNGQSSYETERLFVLNVTSEMVCACVCMHA